MKIVELFEETLPRILRDSPRRVQQVGGSFLFILRGEGGGTWRVDLERTPPEVARGAGAARCTIEAEALDFEQMLAQPTEVLRLYREGRLRVSGELELASRLHRLFAE